MNSKMFSIALLLSALPLFANAGIVLNKGDFLSAERITKNGEVKVSVKLSKSGKAKFKKLNATAVGENVHAEIGGVITDFKLRVPIQGEGLEMGPYAEGDAAKVVADINAK